MNDMLEFNSNGRSIEFMFDTEGDLWIDVGSNRERADYYLKPDDITKLMDWLLMKKIEMKLKEMLEKSNVADNNSSIGMSTSLC